jgi:hypothetical protein
MYPVMSAASHDELDFNEKVRQGFEDSLRTGMDILVAMTSVLVRTGKDFDRRTRQGHLTRHLKHPGELYRVGRAFLQSRLEKRRVLPKDVWPLKALIGWGSDTDIYREQVYRYWGAFPYQFHACTEAGIMALQSWTRQTMTFIPNSNFFEFIPEVEWARSRQDIFYEPRTVLLGDVIPGERYELVITNFYGMPFIRYRLGHLIRIAALEDETAEIALPQMVFETRADDLIDIAGFTRISERSLSQALYDGGVKGSDWVARKEAVEGKPVLHILIEPDSDCILDDLEARIHRELVKIDQGYDDLAKMMKIYPLRVTVLPAGRFDDFAAGRRKAGFDLAQQKPPRMNASEEDIQELLGLEKARLVVTR